MSKDTEPARSPTLSQSGMVASSHHAVSFVGARLLADGGNAVDAALAMAAMSWLALPGQCGIGGDAFAVVREPNGEVWTVSGSGHGPDGGQPDFYRAQGLAAIPMEGPLAVAVPGAMGALEALHSTAASRSLAELWGSAVIAAERGLPCTSKTRGDIHEHRDALARNGDTPFLSGGDPPGVGEPVPQPELARTLRLLIHNPQALYSGEIAERAVEALAARGAPFSGDEWVEGGKVTSEPSITGSYGGLVVHQCPLPAPGWMHLQQAALCDGRLADLPWLSAEAVNWMARAAGLAFRDRWRYCGSGTEAWRRLLSGDAIDRARAELTSGPVPAVPGTAPDGDTTSLVVVDGQGRTVSFLHSLGFTFGARTTIPGTGIVLNNRLGRGAYLTDGHPNEVRPRRKPLSTLNAWIATDACGNLLHAGNTPGGDGQVQWNMQLLSHLVDHGLDPQAAVAAPRFTIFPGSDADVVGQPSELRCESRLEDSTLARVREFGHDVRTLDPWGAGGSAMVISVDSGHGCLVGGADPRQDGVALGV